MRVDQLGLLLWKNFIVRKRQPGILALVFLWPIVVFMILYTVSDNVDPEYHPTCQFPARSMPQDGLLPFVQSFICSVGNPCDPLSEYEEVPSYRNATLGPLVMDMQPMINNETIRAAVQSLPKSIQLLKSMAEILTRPEIKALFDRGIRLGDLFENHDLIKSYLKAQMPTAREGLVDGLMQSSIKLYYLIDTFGSSNVDGVVCSPESLKKYLILPKEEDYAEISSILCNIDSGKIPDILENLSKHFDFTGLLRMIDRVMAKFRDYDFFQDLKRTVDTILDLKTTKKYVPEYLKLHEWLPKVILLFRNVTFKEIDLTFINKTVDVLEPIFEFDRDWFIARRGLLRMNTMLGLIKGISTKNVSELTLDHDDFFTIMKRLTQAVNNVLHPNTYNVTETLDVAFMVLQDGLKLTQRLLDRHANQIEVAAEVLDALKYFFADKFVNTLTYIVSVIENITKMTHHVDMIHQHFTNRIYKLAKKHQALVQKLLIDLEPTDYRTIIRSFSRLDLVERLIEELKTVKPEELICRNETFNEIFGNFENSKTPFDRAYSVLCGDEGKDFISDLYHSFELQQFGLIIGDTLSTMVSLVLNHPVRVEKSNITSMVRSVKAFVDYLALPIENNPDWESLLKFDSEWTEAFEETRAQGRLDITGLHLSVAKLVGTNSLSYSTIRPDLLNMDVLADTILHNLRDNPHTWIGDVRKHVPELIESFYLTVADREKVLKILEYPDFDKAYCYWNSSKLINFPEGSNETLLKSLICSLIDTLQRDLKINYTAIEHASYGKATFNWTAFNEKVIEIYGYIDTLVHQEIPQYKQDRFDQLKEEFKKAWTTDLSPKHAWEISVGLLCDLFITMERPVFSIQNIPAWKNVYAVAWGVSVIFDNVERIVDQIQKNDNVAKLSEILHDMPQTEILIDILLRNLSPLILDFVDVFTQRFSSLSPVLDDYKIQEKEWPCVMNTSIGTALGFRDGTRSIIREIERIACNPGLFVREWREQSVFTRVREIFRHDENVEPLPPFNWTSGYLKFRRLVRKFDVLANDTRSVILAEEPKLADYLKLTTSQVESILQEGSPKIYSDVEKFFRSIDKVIEGQFKLKQENLSVSEVWSPSVDRMDRVLVVIKFTSHVLGEVFRTLNDILRDGSDQINLLSILGFGSETPVRIFHDELPYILSTFLHGLLNLQMEDRVHSSLRHRNMITCTNLFDWWSNFRVSLTPEKYRILKNFTCDLDPENFNAFTELYLFATTTWKKPANKYTNSIASTVSYVYQFAEKVQDMMKRGTKIQQPFSKDYGKFLMEGLKDSLQITNELITKNLTNYQWYRYRLAMEGISEALLRISDAMKEADLKNNRIYLWELVQSNDAREFLKILESNPEETVALMASLPRILQAGKRRSENRVYVNEESLQFKDFWMSMCGLHFYSKYWEQETRVHFLREICKFDPYYLLAGFTSLEFSNFVDPGRSNSVELKPTPLSYSVTRLLDVVSNLTTTVPGLVFGSNIFNSTTWKNLSNETWLVIYDSEEYVLAAVSSMARPYGILRYQTLIASSHFQVLTSLTDILSGGDIWQKLRVMYESSRIKPFLTLVEDMPNLALTAIDTFLTSERLSDYFEKLYRGEVKPCDIDRYLIPPSFVRKKGLLSSITNFCQKIVHATSSLTGSDLVPYEQGFEEVYLGPNTMSIARPGQTNYKVDLIDKMHKFHGTIIRVATEGYKEPRVPTWWTSFEEGTFKDFQAQYRKKDLRTLAHLTVNKSVTLMNNILSSDPYVNNCSWCVTLPLEILNSQLSHRVMYSKLVCQINRMNMSEVHDILLRDFYWNKTATMIKDFKYLRKQKTLSEFISTLEVSLHYVADIIADFQNSTNSKRINDCFYKFVGGPTYSRPGLYISFVIGILDILQRNVFLLDSAANHETLNNLSRLAEESVPIWKPLSEVVRKSDVKFISSFLPNATINVNTILNNRNHSFCHTKIDCRNATILYDYLSSKRSSKVLRYDPKIAMYPTVIKIAEQLAQSLDLDMIDEQKASWRLDAFWDLTWLKEMFQHLSIILGEGGNLLDVASRIDFEDVSNVLGTPDVVDGVVNILKDKTVNKLFDGLNEILEDVEPFFRDQQIVEDLHSIISALESMEIFKNLGLLDMKYVISDMFDNWDVVRAYLADKLGISNDVLATLSEAKVDMISVFMKERHAVGLKDTICSPEKLGDMLEFDQKIVTAEEISEALCKLNDSQTQNVTVTLMKNLNFDYIFKNLMSANIKNILANANLTEAEGKIILDNLGVAAELLPFFKERLSSGFPVSENENATSEALTGEEKAGDMMSSSKFLEDSSELLCGRKLISDSGQFYKIIASIEDNKREFDKIELDSLPTDFCRDTYKTVANMPAGKIIWNYVKPLLRGYILYAPNTTVVNRVMAVANETFVEMEHFETLMGSFQKTLTSLASLSEMGDSLRELQDIMSSDVMKIAIKSFGDSNFEGDFSELNLSEVAWRLKKSKNLIDMVGRLNDLMGCVLMNRVRGFATEEELEKEAGYLTRTNEFLAAVVFLEDSHRLKRSYDEELPVDVTYKIRMDVDYVPSTRRLKNQFWLPGPEGSFIEDLRYLRGFIQLQDSVDRAIIRVKSQRDQKWKSLIQQMPYPCWKHAPFQTTLYESQGVQVCFFFALMMCVGAAVRHIVWERESRNSMVMSVMGLKPWRNTLAWFITSFAELSIVMISIALILLAGKILPKSDPLLVLILFFDYIFSIVTFCYMISTMFSSASLAAVTTVVMFLLTYMPYVIVIAMEAVIGLGYKLLICLSMSTSFCYGCLYAVRKEVQGTGLTWGNMWEESSPGDPMSLGLVLLMIAFDGCLYAVIGYVVTRYTNSGRGFHGLRSRSLWWADTRSLYGGPSYLAFVNNLYFTNDVLHSSAAYQDDESDVSSLTVSEKQIGVRFENVRKVYHTEQGEVVAVDDFTLKLCEGEVTSLLGRNGAGKTTIIKMLTGMLVPTSGEICLNGEEGSKPDIGVCPQDNVLIGTLTPREHMVFYSKLKRPKEGIDMQRNVNEMLACLELGRQEHEPVCHLSGGTKRRLCVALAFLSSPKLVILDEPGAGVDPAARRRIWQLIDRHRIGRTVILSTHHLDEADMLSDTVVVMHKGKILCTGSPLSLKTTHGRGYRLHVSYPPVQDNNVESVERTSLETLRTIVEEVVPNATMNEVSGSEVIVTLPFQGKQGTDNDIAQAAKALEDNRKLLGFSHFSLECDTLERVFLDLCARADSGSSFIRASQDSVATTDHVGLTIPNDDIDLIDMEPTPKPSPIRQVKALLKKRLWHFARDWRAPLAALILPTMFVAVAMGFSLIRPASEDEPPLTVTPKLYNTHPTYFYSIDGSNDPFLQHVSLQLHDRFGDDYAGAWQTLPNDTGTCECLDGQQTCHGVSQAVEGLLQTLPGRPTLDWIVSTHQEYIEKRYGGWSLSHFKNDPLFVVWYNNKGHHSMPSYLSALNEAILRASGVHGRLRTLNHPLKLSSDQLNRTTLLQHVADVGVALVLLVAFSLVAAQGTKELVRERLSEEKRILYLAGVHPVTYWITALIWDFVVFGCSICLAVIVFEIFGLSAYVARDNLPGLCLLLLLFAWAAIPFSHLTEKAFDDPSLSNMVLFCVNTFIGVASLATILVIDILGKGKAAEEARDIIHHVLMIFPQYVLGDALVELSRNDITAELLEKFNMDTYKSPLGWDLLGIHYVFLVVVGGILLLMNLAIECRMFPELRRQRVVYEVISEDEDVARERIRVEGGLDEDLLKTVKLRKEYRSVYGTNVAVQNLSFGVQAGKCFGLLGVNGAGKSTTFKMLTTEIIPTAGRIILRGKEVGSGPLCNGEVGYCPQTDALDGFLSPHQCLTIHGEVCGLSNVPRAVESMLKRFDLLKYAHRRVEGLSGGNKRKLCTAMSVMAPVSVVLMDEPTSGMDPATRDYVAKAIRNVTKNQSAVILTSHSVAECENLCNRVGILAKAGLRCIGTPQHLKHKFGEGYVAFLRFGQPVSPAELRRVLSKHIPQAIVSSRQATAVRLLLPRSQDMPLSTNFTRVKLLAEELKATDYTLTQSSLDQVLVNFSEEPEDEAIDPATYAQDNRNSLPNMYSSMDTIHMETF